MSDKVFRIRAQGLDVDMKLVDNLDSTYAIKVATSAGSVNDKVLRIRSQSGDVDMRLIYNGDSTYSFAVA